MEKAIGFNEIQENDVIRAETSHQDAVFARQGRVFNIKPDAIYSEKGVLLGNDKPGTKFVLIERPKAALPVPLGSVVEFKEKGESYTCIRISPSTWLAVIVNDKTNESRQTAYQESLVARHRWALVSPAKKEVASNDNDAHTADSSDEASTGDAARTSA